MLPQASRLTPLRRAAAACVAFAALLSYHAASATFFQNALEEVVPATTAANEAVEKSRASVKEVNALKDRIEELSKKKKAEEAAVKDLESLDKHLKENAPGVLKRQGEAATELTAQRGKVAALITKLKALKTPEGDAAAKQLEEGPQKRIEEQVTAANTAGGALKEAAGKVYQAANDIAKDLKTPVKALADLTDKADAAKVLKTVPAQFPAWQANITLPDNLKKTWDSLEPELKKITTSPAVEAAAVAKSVDEGVAAYAALRQTNLPAWFQTLRDDLKATMTALREMREKLDKDVSANAVAGIKLLGESEEKQQALAGFLAAAKEFARQLKEREPPHPFNAAVTTEVNQTNALAEKLPGAVALVRDGLAGNFEDFVADFVPLYYFTDVPNLMKILNPEARSLRDVSELRAAAAAARQNVDRADLELADAQAVVSGLQTRVRDLEGELRQAKLNFDSSSLGLIRATRRREELEGRPDRDEGEILRAKQREEDVKRQNDADQATMTKLMDEKSGLPARIAEARTQLLAAQQRVRTERNELILLVQLESEAFAAARDNEPVIFATNVVTSRDPLKQVILHAFPSRKLIHLRGTRANVDKAKEIIALFDRPAPQARLTLWTLELNSTADTSGARKFNESLELIERELSNSRSQIAAVLSYLRECINEEVNGIAATKLRELESARLHSFPRPVQGHAYLAPNGADDLRWARLHFYQKEVLVRLGFDPLKSPINSVNQSSAINHMALPDPAGTTTLGESLVVLSLANASSRYEIMKKFTRHVEEKLGELGLCPTCDEKECKVRGGVVEREWFPSMRRSLGADFEPYRHYPEITDSDLRDGRRDPPPARFPATYAFTSQQKEVTNAITLAVIPRLINRLARLQRELPNAAGADRVNIEREIVAILNFLWDTSRISPREVGFAKPPDPASSAEKLSETAQKAQSVNAAGKLWELSRRQNILRTANAQVARADMMLKQMIDAVDEDIDRHFIQPMMTCLRRKLVNEKGIGVGIVSRTSTLATNRLVARVDARSSAQLALGEEQDALLAAQQLANLYLSAKTGGLLGGLDALGGAAPRRDASEIYGVTSGSVFKVTPIFDPTGQALRFQFDYVLANLVKDPDGSINPQLPRIERHTVNTEVQLNNLELREISRFNTNSRLGISTRYSGGLPVIRDIPKVRPYLPLLGWFVRRSGKAAVIQQSLMLGQTTMYPTIADIFDLLSGNDYALDLDGRRDCCDQPRDAATEATPTPPTTQQTDEQQTDQPDQTDQTDTTSNAAPPRQARTAPQPNPDLTPRSREYGTRPRPEPAPPARGRRNPDIEPRYRRP